MFDVSGIGLLWANANTVVHVTRDDPAVTIYLGDQTTTLPKPPVGGVSDVWATGTGNLYLAGRLEAGSVDTIVTWCEDEAAAYGDRPTEIRGLGGMPGSEGILLTLAPMESGLPSKRCMDLILVLYDGSGFRRI